MAKTKIFISYRRDDAAKEAEQLEEQLEKLQGQVFRDVSAIEVAEKFPKRIVAALKEADIIVVVIGKKWLNISDGRGRRRLEDPNDFVRREIKYALRRAETDPFMDIIPVLVKGARMPKAGDLPDDLRALAEINAHRIASDTFADDVEELSKRMSKLRGQHSTRADEFLDKIDEELGGRPLGEGASFLPMHAGKPELRDLPELATWRCSIGGGMDLQLETKESGAFEGKLRKPRAIEIEGTWRFTPGGGGSLVLTLEGCTFDGEDIKLQIPVERKAGERSYSGRDGRGNYCRLEWIRRRERSENRL